ncbi:MAG: DUF3667 domain-containing protein [Ferruginibacter sp.]|nr:DUF3667 domain-containing protein [Cytophagales bacterium]
MTETEPVVYCRNCRAVVENTYCSVCGQATAVERITFRRIWNDFVEQITDLERGFPHTIRDLALRPGHMVREYLLGKRRPYLKPLQFYLVMLALFFVVSEGLKVDPMEAGRKLQEQISNLNSTERQQKLREKINQTMSANTKVVFSILVITQALALRLLYRRRGFHLAEWLAVSLFITGFHYLFSLSTPLSARWLGYDGRFWAVNAFVSLATWGYTTWAVVQFFDRRGKREFVTAALVYPLSMLILVVLSGFVGGVVGVLAKMGYLQWL